MQPKTQLQGEAAHCSSSMARYVGVECVRHLARCNSGRDVGDVPASRLLQPVAALVMAAAPHQRRHFAAEALLCLLSSPQLDALPVGLLQTLCRHMLDNRPAACADLQTNSVSCLEALTMYPVPRSMLRADAAIMAALVQALLPGACCNAARAAVTRAFERLAPGGFGGVHVQAAVAVLEECKDDAAPGVSGPCATAVAALPKLPSHGSSAASVCALLIGDWMLLLALLRLMRLALALLPMLRPS